MSGTRRNLVLLAGLVLLASTPAWAGHAYKRDHDYGHYDHGL